VTTPSRAPEGSPLLRLITQNFGLKALALALSVLLFSLVHSDVDAQRSVTLDVVALLPPPGSGKMLISDLPSQVKVTLRGSHSRLSSLSRDDLAPIQMDLRDASSGYYYLDPRQIDVGSNVQVVEITPMMVPLTWAVAAERRLPVHVQIEGELDKAYDLRPNDIEVDPGYVTLRGPEQALRNLTSVATEPLSLFGLGPGEHRRRLPLAPLPQHVNYVEDTAIEVRLRVQPAMAERTFKHLEIAPVGAEHAGLRPEHVDVTLRGPQNVIEGMESEALVPYVELDPAALGEMQPHDIKLRGIPAGVEVVGIVPPSTLVWSKGKR
jgi:YbbR domain-containing protein